VTSAGPYSRAMNETPRAPVAHEMLEAFHLLRDRLDGDVVRPVSPQAAAILVSLVFEQMLANAQLRNCTAEEGRGMMRQLFDEQIERCSADAQLQDDFAAITMGAAAATAVPQAEEHAREADPAVWKFVVALQAGTAKPSRRDHYFAGCLARVWESTMAQMYAAAGNITFDEGRAKVAELARTLATGS